jgi:hypothetical protein
MDAGDDAAAQLAAVADVLLTWLRADANSDSPRALAVSVSDGTKLKLLAAFFTVDEQVARPLRALHARGTLARTAARLAVTSKACCDAVRAHAADFLGAAGAARLAHAAAMCRVVLKVAASDVRHNDEVCGRLLALCSRASEVAPPPPVAPPAPVALGVAMTGGMFGGPLMQAAFEEESERMGSSWSEPPPRASAEVWKQLADEVDAYASSNPHMTALHSAVSAFAGAPTLITSPLMLAALRQEFPEADQPDPELMDILGLPDDA